MSSTRINKSSPNFTCNGIPIRVGQIWKPIYIKGDMGTACEITEIRKAEVGEIGSIPDNLVAIRDGVWAINLGIKVIEKENNIKWELIRDSPYYEKCTFCAKETDNDYICKPCLEKVKI